MTFSHLNPTISRLIPSYPVLTNKLLRYKWEEKRAEVAALNAKIADAKQCNIPAEYQHIAGNLLYYIKSGAATSMNEAIRCHNDKLEHDTTMQLLENIYRQNEKIEEGISKTQSDQAFLEGLMVYHTFFQHR